MSENGQANKREPMLWLVFGLPAVVVVAGIVTLVISIHKRDGGVVNDTVQRTAQVQQSDLGPDEEAGRLGLRALVREHAGRVEVIPMGGTFARQEPLHLLAEHPTDNTLDRRLQLAPSANGWLSTEEFEKERQHDWKFVLSDGTGRWKLRARMPKDQQSAVLMPALGTP